MAESGVIALEVFFDYECPFVYRMAELLDKVQASHERQLRVGWRYFSLTQVNSRQNGWTVWDAPASEGVRGRQAFQAAEAARRQGKFEALHMPLLRARHRDRLDIDSVEVVLDLVEQAGLDVERFRQDLADPSLLDALARDHREGVARFGVFGTPTLVFANGTAAYVRLAKSVPVADPVGVFDRVVAVARGEPQILEIKRPAPPSA